MTAENVAALGLVALRLARAASFDHVWWWRSRLPGRKGQPCRVWARGAMNSVGVEFEDGYRTVTSRYAIRKRPPDRDPVEEARDLMERLSAYRTVKLAATWLALRLVEQRDRQFWRGAPERAGWRDPQLRIGGTL